jgi:guanylate kinase
LNKKAIIISGPSGVGKTRLLNDFITIYKNDFDFSVSYTSREIRKGENEGVNYFYVTKEEFEKKIKNNDFLEWAIVHENYYGTCRKTVEKIMKKRHCILDIDVQGAMQIQKLNIKAAFIFIQVPTIEILRERLLNRSTDSIDKINKRINIAQQEMSYANKYDYIINNIDYEKAFAELKDIIFNKILGENE